MPTTEELEKELADVENSIFYLSMTDRWDDGDYRRHNELYDRKFKLEEMLKERGNLT